MGGWADEGIEANNPLPGSVVLFEAMDPAVWDLVEESQKNVDHQILLEKVL